MEILELLGIISLIIGIILAVIRTGKYLGERRYGAEKRANIIHSPLIYALQVLIDKANGVDSIRGMDASKIFNPTYVDLLVSDETRRKVKELKQAIEKYIGARNTCIKITRLIVGNELESNLKKTDQKIKEKKLWEHRGYTNLEALFTTRFLSSFLFSAVKEHDISVEWLKERVTTSSSYWDIFTENFTENGESIEKFLLDVDRRLKSDPAVQWLKEEWNNLLTLSKDCKEMLEQESKKLCSWQGFFYGWKRKIIVEDLQQPANADA